MTRHHAGKFLTLHRADKTRTWYHRSLPTVEGGSDRPKPSMPAPEVGREKRTGCWAEGKVDRLLVFDASRLRQKRADAGACSSHAAALRMQPQRPSMSLDVRVFAYIHTYIHTRHLRSYSVRFGDGSMETADGHGQWKMDKRRAMGSCPP